MTTGIDNDAPQAATLRLHFALPPNDEIYNEIVSTTETKTSAGYIQYHPAKRDEEHNTDMLRAVMLAAAQLANEGTEDEHFESEMGWAGANEGWRPPWAAS